MTKAEQLALVESALSRQQFRSFVEIFWNCVSNDRFVPGYHIDAVCEHLQAVAEGKISRLAINLAIRHSKSLLCSVFFPVWLWVRRAETRVITASYSKTLTTRDALRSRQLIEHPKFKALFGNAVQLTDEQNRQDFYASTAKGHRLSSSPDSRVSGFDADLVVCDDLHSMAERNSQAERDEAWDYFETALCSRLVRSGREAVVLSGHRVHEDDVFGRLRSKYADDGTWSWLVLPEEYTPKFSQWFNAIGWADKRAEGELLWAEKFDAKAIAQEKKTYRHEYSAIFLQEPTPAEGQLFKSEWFRTWGEESLSDGTAVYVLGEKRYAKDKAWRFATVDTAISTSDGADWTVAQVWDSVGGNLVLVDQLRKRLDGTKIVPALAEFYTLHQPQFLSVESEFVGRFVIDQLRQRNIVVKAFSAARHGSKQERAVAAEIRAEAGQVWLPSAAWVADWLAEVAGFPNGSHDDVVDALSQACLLANRYQGETQPEPDAETRAANEVKRRDERFTELLWHGSDFHRAFANY